MSDNGNKTEKQATIFKFFQPARKPHFVQEKAISEAELETAREAGLFWPEDKYAYLRTGNTYTAITWPTGFIVGQLDIEDDWLAHIEVVKRFQQQGIGSTLVKYAVDDWPATIKIPVNGVKDQNQYYMSQEGTRLVNSCIRKGILTHEQCQEDVPLDADHYEVSSP